MSRWLGAGAKIGELKDPILFKQEYPATAAEAFQLSGPDSYIPPVLVAAARKQSQRRPGLLRLEHTCDHGKHDRRKHKCSRDAHPGGE
jgi:hypothetical protein